MSETAPQGELNQQHLWMCLLGAIAGLSIWVLFDVLPDAIENQRLLLWLASAIVGFFILAFALLGSLRWKEAMAGATVLALFDAALLFWASGRFVEFDNLFEESFAPVAWAVILFIGAPFAAAALNGKARDYTFLFDTAWNIVVRYIAAWAFVGLFWAVLYLSDELLGIVGVSIIDDFLDIDPVPFFLTGGALGLALSISQELKACVSPYLPLRLLRLLLPMLLVVVAIFIIALPLRGLSDLFGDFSAAGILLSVAIASITLITSALDRVDEDGVQSALMRDATKALALLLPMLSGLAMWAIWLRVSDYGWTPQRIAAGLSALLVFAYAVLYALAVLFKDQWRRMIRQTNIAMALTVMSLSALWMTPLMDAQRYSSEAQLASYLRGELAAKDFPAWEAINVWGIAGRSVAVQLRGLAKEGHPEIHARLDRAEELSRWEFNQSDEIPTAQALAAEFEKHVQIWPEDHVLLDGYFDKAGLFRLETWAIDCLADATRRCVLVFGPFAAQGADKSLFFVPKSEGGALAFAASSGDEPPKYFTDLRVTPGEVGISEEAYRRLLTGGYRIGPASRQSLWLGDVELTADN
ncbi:DUF4153 domain-containing protein [Cognatishimia activa]|uniref:DUF4153 domain-containing protein n=1 Tax=Cognatishimia activa TaxID=1715691 RepID=UPI00222FCD1D|nr:DUF4153 domain-containing protein [Cognatishimia activa]UZD91553.1 DUF4153 domain-containing protein [Cognatishimia activa]